ncbi:MAG: PGF-pre-PGF domain-containing protein [Methanosarcinales archaeon]|nr:PGF-pre-PGF domain-containing protein [Methanosarcinales archaeon]
MNRKTSGFLVLLLLISICIVPSTSAFSKTAPYSDIEQSDTANWGGLDREFIQAGHNDRIRQTGTINQIRFDVANASNLREFYFTVWRKSGDEYERIGITDNLVNNISSDDINKIDLFPPIEGVHEGDFYGYRINATGDALYIDQNNRDHRTYYVDGGAKPIKDFQWEIQTPEDYIFVIEPYMENTHMVFIGDSIISGNLEHCSFIVTEDITNIPTTIEHHWSTKVGKTYQNMGIGGQITSQINERFESDVIDLSPNYVLIEGGINDVNRGISSTNIIKNWESMIQKSHNNSIIPVIMLILPSQTTQTRLDKITNINNQLIEIAWNYPSSIVVDARDYVGHETYSDCWVIDESVTDDGLHFNSAGHEKIAQAIVDIFNTSSPVIDDVTLSTSTPCTGDEVQVKVRVGDVDIDIDFIRVESEGTQLNYTEEDGLWKGMITAREEGTHTVHVSVRDLAGNDIVWNNSTTYSTLDITRPVITGQGDQLIEQGSTGYNITWTISELYPKQCYVLRNNSEVRPPESYDNGSEIIVEIDTAVQGTWNYTIFAEDESGNNASDQVEITIQDTTSPIINFSGPEELTIKQDDDIEKKIIISIIDVNPHQYWVSRNGTQIVNPTSYESQSDINISINSSTLGTSDYVIFANDTMGHEKNYTVRIIVKALPPVINSPPDQSIEQGVVANIIWVITDKSPNKYRVSINGSPHVSPTDYNSGEILFIPVNTTTEGSFNYTIDANGTSGETSNDQLTINIVEKLPISINITSPFNGSSCTSDWIDIKGDVGGNGSAMNVTVTVNKHQYYQDLNISDHSGTYSIEVPLSLGDNIITATVTDQDNQVTSSTITVTRKEESSDSGSSGSGSGSGSGSSSSGGGSSGEDYKNILIIENVREYISKGQKTCYEFNKEDNIVKCINVAGLTNSGQITTKTEILKNTSSLVNNGLSDMVYKNLNIWMGNSGWATSKNIVDVTISFKVEKSWITSNNIDQTTIRMNRYSNGTWNTLETSLIDQDDNNFYYKSGTPGFSSFAVTGKPNLTGSAGEEGMVVDPTVVEESSTDTDTSADNISTEEKTGIPAPGLFISLLILLIVVQFIRKKE